MVKPILWIYLLTCLFVFLSLHFFYKFYRLWGLWHCYCKSYVRYECLPFGPKRSKGLLLYGHFMARFCAFFTLISGWASSGSSSSKTQWKKVSHIAKIKLDQNFKICLQILVYFYPHCPKWRYVHIIQIKSGKVLAVQYVST